jgi:hypothetical protein
LEVVKAPKALKYDFQIVDAALRKEKTSTTRNMNHRSISAAVIIPVCFVLFFWFCMQARKKLQITDTMLQQPQSKIDVDIRRMARVYEYCSLF